MASRRTVIKHKEHQEAFQEDCEMLLKRFILNSTHNYEHFAQIWQETKFSLVFIGKYKDYELGHFTHLALHCAKKYLLLSECKFTQTGGLYLLYGLYNKQPIRNLIKIRLLHDELQTINTYLTFLKEENILEPMYIFNELLEDNAFDFVASQHEFPLVSKYVTADVTLLNDIFSNSGSNIVQDFSQETNSTLDNICAIDKEMLSKLDAYKRNHKDAFIEYDTKINDELVCVLSTNEYLSQDLLEEQQSVGINEAGASSNTRRSILSQKAVEEAAMTSSKKRDIIHKAFAKDSRSKHLKQLVGDEKLRKN